MKRTKQIMVLVTISVMAISGPLLAGLFEIAPGQPPCPATDDQVTITISGQWHDSCVPDDSQVTVIGNDIYFDAFHHTWLDMGCYLAFTDWSLTESVGPLSPGNYTIHVTLHEWPEGEDPYPLENDVTKFDVVDMRPIGDLDRNCCVDWDDFSIFSLHWLEGGCEAPDWCGGADLDQSGQVNWGDFAIFAAHWLECAAPECVPEMTWSVEPECAPETAQEQDEFSTAEDLGETRFTITVEGQYIHFEDMIKANCCMDYIELKMTLDGNLITIEEVEYVTNICRCLCDFPAAATLGAFAAGTYTVEVIDPYGVSLGTVPVTIGGEQ